MYHVPMQYVDNAQEEHHVKSTHVNACATNSVTVVQIHTSVHEH